MTNRNADESQARSGLCQPIGSLTKNILASAKPRDSTEPKPFGLPSNSATTVLPAVAGTPTTVPLSATGSVVDSQRPTLPSADELARLTWGQLQGAVNRSLPRRLKLRPRWSTNLEIEDVQGYEATGPEEAQREARAILTRLMAPAAPKILAQEFAKLATLTKRREGEEKLTAAAYLERLSEYPADAAIYALREWPNRSPWFPAWAELRELLEDRTRERWLMLRALTT